MSRQPPGGLRAAAVRGLRWSSLQTVGSRLLTTAVFITLARLLPPSAFGLVALASVFTALLTLLVNQGFGQALVQRPAVSRAHLDTAFWSGLGLGVALAALLSLAAGPLAAAFHEPRLAGVLRALSLTFVFAALASTPEALLRRQLRFKALALRTLAANAVGAAVGLTLAVLGAGVWALVAQTLTGAAVGTVAVVAAARWRPGRAVDRAAFGDLFGFGVHVLGTNVLTFLSRRSDDLLIGLVLGTTALGYYTIAYRLLLLMQDVLIGTIQDVAFPTFSRLQGSLARMRAAHRTATRVCATIAVPAFVGMSATSPEVIRTFFGARWGPSVPVMALLALIGAQQAVQYFNGTVLMALGRPGAVLRVVAVNATANVVLFAVAVHWGIVAVAAVFVARAHLLAPLSHQMVRRALGTDARSHLGAFAMPVAAAAVMAAVVTLLRLPLPVTWPVSGRLLVLVLAGGATYLGVLRWLGPGHLRESATLLRGMAGGRAAIPPRQEVPATVAAPPAVSVVDA